MDHLALPTRALISHLRIHFSTIADYVPDADDLQSVAPDLTEVARMYMAEMHACALALVEEERAVAAKGVAEAAIPAGDAALAASLVGDHGPDLDAATADGLTPLVLAVCAGASAELIDVLVGGGAHVDVVCAAGSALGAARALGATSLAAHLQHRWRATAPELDDAMADDAPLRVDALPADAALARARAPPPRRRGAPPVPAAAAEAAAEAAREAEGAAAAADAVDDAPLAVECRAQAAAAAAAAAALRRGAAPTAAAKAAELRGAGGDGGAAKRACAATLADLRAERLRTEWAACTCELARIVFVEQPPVLAEALAKWHSRHLSDSSAFEALDRLRVAARPPTTRRSGRPSRSLCCRGSPRSGRRRSSSTPPSPGPTPTTRRDRCSCSRRSTRCSTRAPPSPRRSRPRRRAPHWRSKRRAPRPALPPARPPARATAPRLLTPHATSSPTAAARLHTKVARVEGRRRRARVGVRPRRRRAARGGGESRRQDPRRRRRGAARGCAASGWHALLVAKLYYEQPALLRWQLRDGGLLAACLPTEAEAALPPFEKALVGCLRDNPYEMLEAARAGWGDGWLLAHMWDLLWRARRVPRDWLANEKARAPAPPRPLRRRAVATPPPASHPTRVRTPRRWSSAST